MGTEENKALVREFYDEVVNQGKLDLAANLMVDTFVDHSGGRDVHGLEAFKQFVVGLSEPFPDLRVDVEELVAEGDVVVARVRVTATHQGQFMDMQATGKRVVFTGADIFRIHDGKLTERWNFRDIFGLVQQIKAPSP